MNPVVLKTGRIACVSIVLLTVTFVFTLVVFHPVPFSGIENFISVYDSKALIPVIPSFLLVIANVPLFVTLFFYAENEKKIFALSGIIFGTVYVVCSGMNYFVQLSVVPTAVNQGGTDFLSAFLMQNPGSYTYAIDNLGYFFLAVAFLFFTGVFSMSGFHSWIRIIFLIFAFSAIIGTIGFLLKIPVLETMVLVSALPYLAAVVLLYIEFGKMKKVLNNS